MFIYALDEQFWFFCLPFFQGLDGGLVVQGALRDAALRTFLSGRIIELNRIMQSNIVE